MGTASTDTSELRVSGSKGRTFTRSHESINVYTQEKVIIALADASGDYATEVTQGTWRITVNGQTSEILSYAATATEVAAAISKLSSVSGLVTVTPGTAAALSSHADRTFTVTFTKSEGDVMHVTALSVDGDELKDNGGVEAAIGVSKEQDGFAFYDPAVNEQKADMLADDVSVGTVINITASEVVNFVVVDPDTVGCIDSSAISALVDGAATASSGVLNLDGNAPSVGFYAVGSAGTGDKVSSEIVEISSPLNQATRAAKGTSATSHADDSQLYKLRACTTATDMALCSGSSCPSLIFEYDGFVSKPCQIIDNLASAGAAEQTKTSGVNGVDGGTDEVNCQATIREIPGLSTARVDYAVNPSASDKEASGVAGVDLISVAVTLPKGVDGAALSAKLSGSLFSTAASTPLTGNEYLFKRHWRNNNGRSFTVTKARENRVGAITTITDSSNQFKVIHEADVHGMTVNADETVSVHNIPNGRTAQANSHTIVTGSADMTHSKRGQVYKIGDTCLLQLIEDGTQGNTAAARFHLVSGTCNIGDAHLLVAHQSTTQILTNTQLKASGVSPAFSLSSRITGVSDTHLLSNEAASATDSDDFITADSARVDDALQS